MNKYLIYIGATIGALFISGCYGYATYEVARPHHVVYTSHTSPNVYVYDTYHNHRYRYRHHPRSHYVRYKKHARRSRVIHRNVHVHGHKYRKHVSKYKNKRYKKKRYKNRRSRKYKKRR